MNDVPIMFFQVAATAIPTLLIAVAVGIKQGATFAEGFVLVEGVHRRILGALGVFVTLSIVLGEFAALRAVIRGSGNQLELELAFAAIAGCLLLITIEMVTPLVKKLSPRGGGRLLSSVAGLWMVLAIYTLLISGGLIPL